jgi:hypothetical protein
MGTGVGVLVGAGVFVGAGSGVSVGVGVRVGTKVAALVDAGVAVGGSMAEKNCSGTGVADTGEMGRIACSAVWAGSGVAVAGALDAGAPSVKWMAMIKMPMAKMAQARSIMLAAAAGHHRAGTSRFPLQALQNISPALISLPHHLHCWAGNSLLIIHPTCSGNGAPSLPG